MVNEGANGPAIGEHDADEFEEGYRSLSVPAVLAAVLGLASPTVFVASLLVVVPLLTLVVSLVALRGIAANPEVLTGRRLAKFGLVLATICLVGSFTKGIVTDHLLAAQARPTAEAWIKQVVAGHVAESYLLTLYPAIRLQAQSGAVAAEPTVQTQLSEAGAAYAEREAVGKLSKLGEDAKIELLGAESVQWLTSDKVGLTQRYRVQGDSGDALEVALQLERSTEKGKPPAWRVAEFALIGS